MTDVIPTTAAVDRRAVDFDPMDPTLSQPDSGGGGTTETYWAVMREMQNRCPVVHSAAQGGFSVLTRRDDVIQAAQDWETFSSASGVSPTPFDMGDFDFRLTPIDTDPPYQRSIRKLLNPYFSPGSVERLEPHAREVANELIDRFADRGGCDYMADFAYPFPSLIFFRLILGLPEDAIGRASHAIDRLLSEPENAAEVLFELAPWCVEVLNDRQENRRDDVLDAVVHGVLDDGRELTAQERLEIFVLLIIGGLETTANALGNAMKNLAAAPGMQRELAGGADIGRACDEFLRIEAPVPGLRRQVTKDTEIGGTRFKAGDWVFVAYGAANRDPNVWADPDTIDIHRRDAGKHSSFGVGPHRCLGSHLARMEMRIGLEEFLRRIPEFGFDPENPMTWRNSFSRGPVVLPLTFPA